MSCCTRCGPAAYATGGAGNPLGHPDNSPLGLQQFAMEGHEGRRVYEQWNWKYLDAGQDRSYGILQDGSLWGWGKAPLGDGTLNDSDCPVHIHAGPWKMVKDGYAIKEDDKSLWLISGQTGLEPRGELRNAGANAFLSSQIASVAVTNGGNYSIPPTVRTEITGVNQEIGHTIGTQASLKAVLSLRVHEIVVNDGGSGYATPPAVRLRNAVGQEAECEAVVRNGSVIGVIAKSQNAWEYAFGDNPANVLPVVEFSVGDASATVKLRGPVTRIDVVSGGDGYTTVPSVVVERSEGDEVDPFGPGWPTTTQAAAVASLTPSAIKTELDPRVFYNQNAYPAEKVGRILSEQYQSIPSSVAWGGQSNFYFEGTRKISWFGEERTIQWKEGFANPEIEMTGVGSGASAVVDKEVTTITVDTPGTPYGMIGDGYSGTHYRYSLRADGNGGSGWKFPPHANLSGGVWETSYSPPPGTPVNPSPVPEPVVTATSREVSYFLPALEIDGPPTERAWVPSVFVDKDTTAHAEMLATGVDRIDVDESAAVYTSPPEVKISQYALSPTPMSEFCGEFDGKRWKDVRAARSTAATPWRNIIHGCDADGGFAIEEGTGHIWHWGLPAYQNSRSVYPHPFGGLVTVAEETYWYNKFETRAKVPPPPLGISRHAGILGLQSGSGSLVVEDWASQRLAPGISSASSPWITEPQACGYLEEPVVYTKDGDPKESGLLFAPPVSFDRFCGSGQRGRLGAITPGGILYLIQRGAGIYCGPINAGRLNPTVYELNGGSGYSFSYYLPTAQPSIALPCLIKPLIGGGGMTVGDDGSITSVVLHGGYGYPDEVEIPVVFHGGLNASASGVVYTEESTPFDLVIANSSLWPCRAAEDGKWYRPNAYALPPQLDRRQDIDESFASITSAADTVCRRDDGRLTTAFTTDLPQYHIGGVEAKVTTTGSGYTLPAAPMLPAQHPDVVSASVKPNAMTGGVYAVCVIDGGSGYEETPVVEVEGNASVTCAILGPVVEVAVTNGGSGYTTPPRVTFSGVGIPAVARCVLNGNGSVASVVVEYGGEYRVKPAVVIEGNATAACRINGSIIYAEVVDSGSGYTSTPTVTVPGNARLAARVLYDYESPDFDRNPPTKLWLEFNDPKRLPSALAYVGQSKSPSGNSGPVDSGVCFHVSASRAEDGSYSDISAKKPGDDDLKFYCQASVVLGGNTFLVPTTELAVAGVAFSRPYKNEFFDGSKGRNLFRPPTLINRRRRQSARFVWGETQNLPDTPIDAEIPLDFVMKGNFVNGDGSAFNHAAALSWISSTQSAIRDMKFSEEPTARIVDHTGLGPTATGVLSGEGMLTSWSVSNAASQEVFTSNFRWEFNLPSRRRAAIREAVASAAPSENGTIGHIALDDRGEYSQYDPDPEVIIEGDGQGASAVVVMAQPISGASFSWLPPSWGVEGVAVIGGDPVVDAQIEYPQQYPYFQMNILNGGLYRSKPRVFVYGSGRVEELIVGMGNKAVASVEVISGGSEYTSAAVSIVPKEQPAETVSYKGIDFSFQYRTLVTDNWDIEYVKFNKPSTPIWRSICNPDSVGTTNQADQWSDRCLFVFYESGHVSEVRVCNDTSGFAAFKTTWDQFPPVSQTLQLTGDATQDAAVQITRPVWSECYSEKGFDFFEYTQGDNFGATSSDRRYITAKREN